MKAGCKELVRITSWHCLEIKRRAPKRTKDAVASIFFAGFSLATESNTDRASSCWFIYVRIFLSGSRHGCKVCRLPECSIGIVECPLITSRRRQELSQSGHLRKRFTRIQR